MRKTHVFTAMIFIFLLGGMVFIFKNKTAPEVKLSSFAVSAREIQSIEAATLMRVKSAALPVAKEIPSKFRGNPAFQLFSKIEQWL